MGELELLARIGSGPASNVFLARDATRRYCALKMLRPSFAARSDCLDRLCAEARAGAVLSHPNVVQAIAFPQIDGVHVLVMEHVFGATLDEVLAREGSRGLPLEAVLTIMAGVCEALAHAHARGIHARVATKNVLLGFDGAVKLCGFERAQFEEAADVFAAASLLHEMLPGKQSSLPPATRFRRASELREVVDGIRAKLRSSRELAPVAALLRNRFQARIARGPEAQGDPASSKDVPVVEGGASIDDPLGIFVRLPFAYITDDLQLD